jgi:hypothetical protein
MDGQEQRPALETQTSDEVQAEIARWQMILIAKQNHPHTKYLV